MRMKDKTAVITGAASGIGFAIARRFAEEGANIAIADIDAEGAERAAATLHQAGADAMAVTMDVTDEAQVDSGVDAVVDRYGSLDVAVCNAGIQHIDTITDLSFADWRRVIAIHLDGAFLTTRAAMRHMKRLGNGGSIIYMGSVQSKDASPAKSPYATAKHGIVGLAKSAAKEGIEFNVRTNVICPGYVRTPLVDKQIPEQAALWGISEEEVVKKIMLGDTIDGEFTTLEEVAEMALFFATYPSNALTGQSMVVSHGKAMQ